jgi:hypothetical protein
MAVSRRFSNRLIYTILKSPLAGMDPKTSAQFECGRRYPTGKYLSTIMTVVNDDAPEPSTMDQKVWGSSPYGCTIDNQ